MSDPTEALAAMADALTEALYEVKSWPSPTFRKARVIAEALTASGYAIVRSDELERLRAIEEAARAFTTDDWTWDRETRGDPGPALRAALESRS